MRTAKVKRVTHDNRKRAFHVSIGEVTYPLPYAKLALKPAADDPIVRVYPDPEIGRQGFTYVLASGREDTVPADAVLDYNKDPNYMRDLLLYKLSVEAGKRVRASRLSRREIARLLKTSAAQVYRLLDPTNYRKSVDQLVSLLQVLDCEVDLVVRAKSA